MNRAISLLCFEIAAGVLMVKKNSDFLPVIIMLLLKHCSLMLMLMFSTSGN